MSQPPPPALLRLREADVVRLCGLSAAARGLELVARHAVASGRRADARLDGVVTEGTQRCAVWAALPGEATATALRWGCDCHNDAPAPTPGTPGCVHVAALLTAWMRHPDDFAEPKVSASPTTERAVSERAAAQREQSPAPLRRPDQAPGPRSARAPVTLAEELARLPAAELAALARRVIGTEPGETAAARTALVVALSEPASVRALVARLEEGAQALLADLLVLGGALTAADLDGIAQRAGRAISALDAEINVLERHGLLFRVTSATGAERGWRALAGWRIPPETQAALDALHPLPALAARERGGPPLLPLVSTPTNADAAEARHRGAQVERATPRPLILALALLARAPGPLGPFEAVANATSTTAPGRASSTQVSRRPMARALALVPGDLAPDRLAELARAAGLTPGVARLARRVLLWARDQGPGQPITDLTRVPSGERALALRAGFRLWRSAESAAELVDLDQPESPIMLRYDTAHMAFRPAALAGEVRAARAFVLSLVARLTPGTWYGIEALLDLIWRLYPLFLRGRQQAYQTPAWWLERRDERRPLRPLVAEDWRAAEGVYIRQLLTEPLYAWGALDLARDSGAVVAFRLNSFGAYLLSETAPEPSVDLSAALAGDWGPPVLAIRDGTLAAQPLAAGAALLDALTVWGQPTALASGRLVYTLLPERACAAFDQGAQPQEVLVLLRAADPQGGSRVAEAVAARLDGWRASYGQTRIESGWALLEARDEATLLEALASIPQVAARARRVGAALALVQPADLATARAALARRGYHL